MIYDQLGTSGGVSLLSQLQPYNESFKKASSLDDNEAKLCVYVCILTYKILVLSLFPILALFGEHGSGKAAIIKVILQLVNNPIPGPKDFPNLDRWVGLKINDTYPSLRDGLKEDTAAFIEEGDADFKINEQLIADRYSRQTAVVRQKKPEAIGHSQGKANIFGATVIHKRRGFKDPATSSRSIFLKTKLEPHKSHKTTIFMEKEKEDFRNLARSIDVYPLSGGTRAHDLWNPLIGLAINVGDGTWIAWASEQVEKQIESHASGGNFDPQKAVILGVLSRAVIEDASGNLVFKEGKYELYQIKSSIDQNLGVQMSVNEIEFGLKQQDFEVKRRKGIPRVEVTAEKLKKACVDLGIDDEAVSALP